MGCVVQNTELSSLEGTRCQFNGGKALIKLGIDVHQDFYVVVAQMGESVPKPPQRFQKEAFLHWAARLKRKSGAEVHAVYEACGFGFALQRQLSALSVRSLSKRPMRVHGPEPGAHAQEQRAMVTVQPALSQMAPYAQEQGSGQQAPGALRIGYRTAVLPKRA
jgi:hypothetical protein